MCAVEALREFSRKQGIAEQQVFGLCLALEECASNIVNHALQRDRQKTFQVAFQHAEDAITIELRDRGPAFDPTAAAQKARAEDDDPPGGWGIQLVRRYIDEIHYQRENEQNVLHLTKRFTATNQQNA